MKIWYLYAVADGGDVGNLGSVQQIAAVHSRPRQMLLFQSVGVLAFALVVLVIERFRIEPSLRVSRGRLPADFSRSSDF